MGASDAGSITKRDYYFLMSRLRKIESELERLCGLINERPHQAVAEKKSSSVWWWVLGIFGGITLLHFLFDTDTGKRVVDKVGERVTLGLAGAVGKGLGSLIERGLF